MLTFGKNLYKVTKIKIKDETQFRLLNLNHTTIGQAYLTENNRLIVGGVDGIITSKVENIKPQDDGCFIIETENSIYNMELLND